MTLRRKVLVGLLTTVLVVVGGCGIALLALVPGEGPAMLSGLPIDADVIAYAEDVDALWGALESSEGFADFRKGPAWRALLDAGLEEALDAIEASGIEPSRSNASHLVGREAGAAVWLDASGRRVTSWLAAFRIDTYVRAAEVAAGRLFMGDSISRREEGGRTFAELRQGSQSFPGRVKDVVRLPVRATRTQTGTTRHWTLLGDLLLVSDSRETLERAAEETGTRGGDVSFAGVFRSGLEAKRGSPRAGVRLGRPEGILGTLLGGVGSPRQVRNRAMATVAAVGLPAPVDMITISMRVDGSRVLEDSFLASPAVASGEGQMLEDIAPPTDTYFWWRFRPGREAASEYAWAVFMKMVPPQDRRRGMSTSGADIFRQVVMPRVGSEVAVALADQEVRAEGGGFPAQYTFVGMKGARLIHAGFEQLMRARSLGIYSEGERLPVSYPYVVRSDAGRTPVYEMAVRDTRRFDGFRPSVAVRADDLVYCSSLEKLRELLKTPGNSPTVFPELDPDGWLGFDEDEVLRMEWRPPKDFRQLRNAYDYMTEIRRHRGPVRKLMADDTDYEAVWRIASDVLARVRRHSRVGFAAPGGVRVRAVWDFADGE